MVTVWTFFGSVDAAAGAGAGAGGGAGAAVGAGAGGGTGAAVGAGATTGAGGGTGAAVGAALGAGKTGIVAMTRGAAFGGWICTGCSSRDTSFSPELGLVAPAWLDEPAWVGMILFGPSLALMIGGSDGRITPPNIAR